MPSRTGYAAVMIGTTASARTAGVIAAMSTSGVNDRGGACRGGPLSTAGGTVRSAPRAARAPRAGRAASAASRPTRSPPAACSMNASSDVRRAISGAAQTTPNATGKRRASAGARRGERVRGARRRAAAATCVSSRVPIARLASRPVADGRSACTSASSAASAPQIAAARTRQRASHRRRLDAARASRRAWRRIHARRIGRLAHATARRRRFETVGVRANAPIGNRLSHRCSSGEQASLTPSSRASVRERALTDRA